MPFKCLGFCRSKHTSASEEQHPTIIEELCHQFSLADLRKSTKNFDESLIIERGAFSIVLYKACLEHNGATDYTVTLKRMDWKSYDQFKNEIELLCQLRHPNLVSLKGFCNHKSEKIIVYEYMPNGSLYDHLYDGDAMEPLSWKKRVEICIGVARGVHYLHTGAKRTIIHRDIKPRNIRLDRNMIPKLSDFGLSVQGQLFSSKPKHIQTDTIAGTFDYIAPETMIEGHLTDRSDVYSFGVVLLEVVLSKRSFSKYLMEKRKRQSEELAKPYGFQRLPVEEILDPVLVGKVAPQCWEAFIDIIDSCLKNDPNERPAMGQVELQLEHALTLQHQA